MTTNLVQVFLICMAGAWFGRRVPSRSVNVLGFNKPNLIAFLIVSLTLILYAGWRNNVGDTFFYLHTYHLLQEGPLVKPTLSTPHFLFELFQYELIHNGLSDGTFIMISYLVFAVPAMLVIRNYSVDYTWAMFFFFVTGIYFATMNGIRQFMAAGVLLCGTPLVFSPKRWHLAPYMIFVVIAALIHSSALIMIPLCFLCRQRAWSFPTMLIILGGAGALIFVSLFSSSFINFLQDTSYSSYDESWFFGGNETGTTVFRVLVNVLPAGLAFYYTKQLRTFGPITDVLINFSVVHAMFYLLALYNWIFARFTFFTCIYVVLLLAAIFVVISKDPHGKWMIYFAVFLYLIFFIKDAYANCIYMFYGSDYFTPNNNTWFRFLA